MKSMRVAWKSRHFPDGPSREQVLLEFAGPARQIFCGSMGARVPGPCWRAGRLLVVQADTWTPYETSRAMRLYGHDSVKEFDVPTELLPA